MDAFIARHLEGVSRTYALLVPMLPRPLAEAVGLAYLLMRIVDTLEDAPELTTEERRARFALLEAALADDAGRAGLNDVLTQPVGENAAERALMQDTPEVLSRIAALDASYRTPIHDCARAMSGGMQQLLIRSAERDVPYPAVRDAAELREYCYYVAGVVGEMLCAMMAHFLRLPALLRLRGMAVELGLGLQMVNILKDALRDAKDGRRYLPQAGDGVDHSEVYRAVLAEARACLDRGIEFVLALPVGARELRAFCGLPIAWGAMTLARAERNIAAAKVGRGAIQASIARFGKIVTDNTQLRRFFADLFHRGEAALAPGAERG